MVNRLLSPTLTKIARVCGIALLTIFITTAIVHQPSYASNTKFFCGQSKGIPVTFARREDGRRVAMIRWVSSNFFSSKLTPLQRCKQVSQRFQKNFDNGSLRTIITGTLNGQPVVCAAASTNDACTNNTLLFTLKRGANARFVVERLLDQRGLASGKIQDQSGDNTQIYVDFDTFLNSAQVER